MNGRNKPSTLAVRAVMLVLGACLQATPQDWAQPITFEPHRNSRTVDIKVLDYPRDIFQVDFPEVVHKDDQFLLGPEGGGFRDRDVKWDRLGPHRWLTTYVKPSVGEYSISLDVRSDEIDMLWRVQNLSEQEWKYVAATPDFFLVKAPDFTDPTLDRTYLRIGRKWVPLKQTDHSDGRWSTQWYVPKDSRPCKLMGVKPHRKDSFGLSRDEPDNGLVAIVSRDRRMVVGQAFEKVQYVCLNSPTCVHPAAQFGDIAPGKEASIRGKFYFVHGSLDDLMLRYLEDFPSETSGTAH